MTRNLYDNPDSFAGDSRANRSIQGLDGAPEWPSLRALLPDLRGLDVLDLGCGHGGFCRYAAERGAANVLGVDVSETMLTRAARSTTHANVSYRRADLETVALPEASFGLVYSALAFHYVERLPELMRSIHRALAPGGRLVFSIEHPVFTAPRHPAFMRDANGARVWPLDGYRREGERATEGLAPGVVKRHRTLGTLVNLLIDAGFTLRRLIEWGPTDAQVEALPALDEERDRPMLLLVSAQR
jgi:SAM-dependent methyltransferase